MGGSTLETKVCRICNLEQPIQNFYVRDNLTGGRRHECIECHGATGRNNYLKRKPEIDEKLRVQHLQRSYSISPADWELLYLAQDGVCAICGQSETKMNNKSGQLQRLCVDHDHITRKHRGLLCNRCNTTIGKVNEDLSLLEKMVMYLRHWRTVI
mgnify:CR=1 FL=1